LCLWLFTGWKKDNILQKCENAKAKTQKILTLTANLPIYLSGFGFIDMPSKSAKILLTGLPGCGKTTAIIQIANNLNRQDGLRQHSKIAGFYTQEIREENIRKGFRWKRFDGAEGILAHIDIKSPFRVGKYRVDVAGFEKSVVPILDIDKTDADIFIIDEIGKMECMSGKFVAAVRRLLASEKRVLATVAQKGAGLISEIKNYPDSKLFRLTEQNRDKIIAEIAQTLLFENQMLH
jgi:nucleoside-triphosphatase